MPITVELDGKRYEIPNKYENYNLPWKVITQSIDLDRRAEIVKEYNFEIPNSNVEVYVYETAIAVLANGDHIVCGHKEEVDCYTVQLGDLMPGDCYVDYQPKHNLDEEVIISKDMYEKKFGHTKVKRLSYPKESEKSKEELRELIFREMYKGDKNSNKGQEEGSKMRDFTTGTRVTFPDPRGREPSAVGTVMELKDGWPAGTVLVCLDVPMPDEGSASSFVGSGFGFLVRAADVALYKTRSSEQKYYGVPEHIGVFAPEAFIYQEVEFPPYSLGRVMNQDGGPDGTLTVSWFNVRSSRMRAAKDDKKIWNNVWSVPADQLRWCRFDPKTLKVKQSWYQNSISYSSGEYLVYTGEKPVGFTDPSGRFSYVLTPGVILSYENHEGGILYVTVRAGMAPEALGAVVRIRKQDAKRFEGTFIPAGANVEIVAEVIFKKNNLQGRRAKVILPTDMEGDVGLEFQEDLGAGSLDGVGREGKCLYVPARSVKKISG